MAIPKFLGRRHLAFLYSFSRQWRVAFIIAGGEKGKGSWVTKALTDFHLEYQRHAVVNIPLLLSRYSL